MKTLLVVNPVAGQGRGVKILGRLSKELEKRGVIFETYKTRFAGDGTARAKRAVEEGFDMVVAVGGDGTVGEVAGGLAGSDVCLGVVPSGTVDVFAREMNIPVKIGQAADVLVGGRNTEIDLGKSGTRHFVLVGSAGIDAQLIRDVSPEAKRFLKDLAYPLTGVKTLLTHRPRLMRVETDSGRVEEGYYVVVGNARYYAGRFSITSQASIDDGYLDVCVFKKGDIASFIRYIQGVVRGRHLMYEDVEYMRAKSVLIDGDGSLVQADGDLIGRTPVRFEIEPQALKVRVGRSDTDTNRSAGAT